MNANSRVLVVFEKLTDRRDSTIAERQMLLDHDIRDAMARAARALDTKARSVNAGGVGYEWNLDDITYDIAHIDYADHKNLQREVIPTVVGTLLIKRPS